MILAFKVQDAVEVNEEVVKEADKEVINEIA